MNKIAITLIVLLIIFFSFLVGVISGNSAWEEKAAEVARLLDVNNKLSRAIGTGKRIVYFVENKRVYILMINYAKDRNEAKNASIYFPDNKLTVMPSEVIDDNTPLFKMDYRQSDRKNIFYLGDDVVESDVPF